MGFTSRKFTYGALTAVSATLAAAASAPVLAADEAAAVAAEGTLFGRNTIGGVINIARTEPTGEVGGKLEVSYGRFNTFSGRGVFNTPITEVLAAKFFYFNNRTDGWYHDGITGRPRGENHN